MRQQRLFVSLLCVVAVIAGACDGLLSPTVVVNNNQGTGGQVQPSPGPGLGAQCQLVDSVAIGRGSASCTVGLNNELTVGCGWDLTATPRDAAGNPADPTVHGPNVLWSSSSNVRLDDRGNNPLWNKRLVALSPGPYVVQAQNCGKTGRLEGTVQ